MGTRTASSAKVKTPEEVFGERLAAIRRGRPHWTQAYLAERVADFGGELDRVQIAKIETGRRGVSLNEALILSAALDVSPIFLMFPGDRHEKVAIGDTVRVAAGVARKWLKGDRPLRMEDDHRLWNAERLQDLDQWAVATQMLAAMVDDLNDYLIPLEMGQLDDVGKDELQALATTMKGVLDQQIRAAKKFAEDQEASK